MGKHADRRRRQEADHLAQVAMANERPNEPPTVTPIANSCPARFGPHDFTMKGRDGIRRCWYCAQRKPEAGRL
jgi:hypothetical protein